MNINTKNKNMTLKQRRLASQLTGVNKTIVCSQVASQEKIDSSCELHACNFHTRVRGLVEEIGPTLNLEVNVLFFG